MLSQAEEAGLTAAELRLKAYQDRNEAKLKLDLHKESCSKCKAGNWRIIGGTRY
jgi:hypothetical protein